MVVTETGEVSVLDPKDRGVFIFSLDGHYLTRVELPPIFSVPMGLAASHDNVYIGDNGQRRIAKFKRDGTLVGAALGYEGVVAALALDRRGGLWVSPGHGSPPLALKVAGGFASYGYAYGGPFLNPSFHAQQWHWLRGTFAVRGADSHFSLFVYRSHSGTPPAALTGKAPWQLSPTLSFADSVREPSNPAGSRERWVQMSLDVESCLFEGEPQESIWVGLEFHGEGLTSPTLSQLRLDFDHTLYLQNLPALYQDEPSSRRLLARLLTMFESAFEGVESHWQNLPALLDAESVPSEYLAWLSGWLALDAPANWDEAETRAALRDAFELYGRRGTPQGLIEMLRRFAYSYAVVQEPLLQANWWQLAPSEPDAEDASTYQPRLGFTTMLAPVEPGPPVLGSNAVLEQSHLIRSYEYGAPLFENVAHQFSVRLYQGKHYSEANERAVRALIEREKPAHTLYELCLVEPTLRVGYQAAVGIDTIVAGEPLRHPDTLQLRGEPAGQIGASQIGSSTRLTTGALD